MIGNLVAARMQNRINKLCQKVEIIDLNTKEILKKIDGMRKFLLERVAKPTRKLSRKNLKNRFEYKK